MKNRLHEVMKPRGGHIVRQANYKFKQNKTQLGHFIQNQKNRKNRIK